MGLNDVQTLLRDSIDRVPEIPRVLHTARDLIDDGLIGWRKVTYGPSCGRALDDN